MDFASLNTFSLFKYILFYSALLTPSQLRSETIFNLLNSKKESNTQIPGLFTFLSEAFFSSLDLKLSMECFLCCMAVACSLARLLLSTLAFMAV